MTKDDREARPRLHHWLIATAIIFAMGHVVPLFAAFI